jgi:hypothetical protein
VDPLWHPIVLTSIPFVLICFLLVRLVAPLSLKDTLHLSFYPIGAGVFSGALFALVASATVATLVTTGSIQHINYYPTQWGNDQQVEQVLKLAAYDCLKQESLPFSVFASGFQEAFTRLKSPIDDISWVRPLTTVFYLLVAARVFMAAVECRKSAVFGLVVLAALVSTAAVYLTSGAYFNWTVRTSDCWKQDKMMALGWGRYGESALQEFVQDLSKDAEIQDASVRAEGRTVYLDRRFKTPILDKEAFHRSVDAQESNAIDMYCHNDFLRAVKATWIETVPRASA